MALGLTAFTVLAFTALTPDLALTAFGARVFLLTAIDLVAERPVFATAGAFLAVGEALAAAFFATGDFFATEAVLVTEAFFATRDGFALRDFVAGLFLAIDGPFDANTFFDILIPLKSRRNTRRSAYAWEKYRIVAKEQIAFAAYSSTI